MLYFAFPLTGRLQIPVDEGKDVLLLTRLGEKSHFITQETWDEAVGLAETGVVSNENTQTY